MSAKTGVAPVSATELAVAAKVNDGTMTSSPGPIPHDEQAQVQSGGAGVDRDARASEPEVVRELVLEGRDLRALRDHAAAHDPVDGGTLLVPDDGLGGRDEVVRHIVSKASPSVFSR